MLFKNFISNLKRIDIDEKIKKIIKIGLYISAFFAIVASIILFTYLNFFKTLTTYYLGLLVLKLSIILAVSFIIVGLVIDKIKRDLF